MEIRENYSIDNEITLYQGDCMDLLKNIPNETCDLIITSPPYCIGKEYEDKKRDLKSFVAQQEKTVEEIYRILKVGGSVCWQVGYNIADREVIPLDFYVYKVFLDCSERHEIPLVLRNRIIWTFGHGLNSYQRFSGRHETILWFTKGSEYTFDLDSVRVPQKYPGKRAYRGNKKGEFSGNQVDNPITHVRGAVSMARSQDPDSASSQFFIVQSDSNYLDGQYAGFGYVTDGMDIVDQICKDARPTDGNGSIAPEDQPVIESVVVLP